MLLKAEGSLSRAFFKKRIRPAFRLPEHDRKGKRSLVNRLFSSKLWFLLTGFLLGRAVILAGMAPFALSFLASVFVLKRKQTKQAFVLLVAGAATVSIQQLLWVGASIFVFFLYYRLFVRKSERLFQSVPYTVFAAAFSARLLLLYFGNGQLRLTDFAQTAIEAALAFILTMIFLQSLPLLSSRVARKNFRNEEIICFMILLASVMTGTAGWYIADLSLQHIFSRYFVLLFAFVGGAAIGSTVGVVIGLILSLTSISSLYQMSLLAFSGLLGGLLKEGKKPGVGLGLVIGTLLIVLYSGRAPSVATALYESLAAIMLLFFTPKTIYEALARYIPGTVEYDRQQQQYLRKIRDVTAARVQQFSQLFHALANSFSSGAQRESPEDRRKEVDEFLSRITAKTCQNCFLKRECWEKNFSKTYDYMQQIMEQVEDGPRLHDPNLQKKWNKHCVKPQKVVDVIHREINFFQANEKLKRQVYESRKLVADQLLGVSEVMNDFAREMKRERQTHQWQEERMIEALREIGLEVGNVEIYSLKEGNVDIEMNIPFSEGRGECEKIIAPMLSDILGEAIVVKKETYSPYPGGYCVAQFGSAKEYCVETGVASTAKGGSLVSGDSYSLLEVGVGKYAVAISDGMGNGEKAHLESSETLRLLQKVLKSGIDEEVAIKSINSILALKTTDEMFATLDLAMIDLQLARAKFLKIGACPSFIKRGDEVIPIKAGNLPMGIIREFDVDVVNEQLKSGDLLIMMSDGVYEGPRHVENQDIWMKRKIRGLKTDAPQEVCDVLLEEVIHNQAGQIRDDMTVVCVKIEKYMPKWATISLPFKNSLRSRKKAQ